MSKTWVIFKYELVNTLTRRSFLVTLFIIPLIPAILVAVLGSMGEQNKQAVAQLFTPNLGGVQAEGYVDNANLIQAFPDWLQEGRFVQFEDEASASQALDNGSISGYYLVPKDYLTSGTVNMTHSEFNPLSGFEKSSLFEEVIRYNLLGADPETYEQYVNPVNFEFRSVKPGTEAPQAFSTLGFFLAYGVTMLFYVIVISSSSMMLNNVTKEKENRVIEILLSTIDPLQLFTGKILALGVAGLLQVIVWFGSGLIILRLGGNALSIPENFQLPFSLLIWSIVFFLLGYTLYGSLMAGIGAMVPNLREASQATFIVIVPIITPVVMLSALINNPNGLLAVIISIFPLTSPVGMMTRLAAAKIPIWQPILAAILLLVTVILVIRGVAKLFKTQTMLTGQKFTLTAFLKVFLQKA